MIRQSDDRVAKLKLQTSWLVAIVCIMLVSAYALVSIFPTSPLTPGYLLSLSSVPQAVLDPNTTRTNLDRNEAIDIFTNNATLISLWRDCISSGHDDQDDHDIALNEIQAILKRDYIKGMIIWDVSNMTTDVWIDAESGEIVHFFNKCSHEGSGSVSLREAVNLSWAYAASFSVIPSDAELENASFIPVLKTFLMNESGDLIDYSLYAYAIRLTRFLSSIASDDSINMWVSTSGELLFYDKTWSLTMPASVDARITDAEAEDIAREAVQGSVITVDMAIKRPNYYWTDTTYLYGDNTGRLCWVVTLDEGGYRTSQVWVDAHSGDIVGGWATL